MVGVTMVLAIAICIFGAAGLYAALSRPFSDLVPIVAPAAPAQGADIPSGEENVETPAIEPTAASQPIAQATEAPDASPTETSNTSEFEPDYQIGAGQSVNFRSGPSTEDSIIVALPPATPLEYLNEDEPTANPNDGDRWMRFRTESGEEGWIREIDTEPYQP
jgi:hypothetical protein